MEGHTGNDSSIHLSNKSALAELSDASKLFKEKENHQRVHEYKATAWLSSR